MTGPPDRCPVHHLPPDTPVRVHYGRIPEDTTAGVVCQQWHDLAPLREAMARTLAEAAAELERDAPHTTVPPAFRRPTEE